MLKRIVSFFRYDIWKIQRGDVSTPVFYLVNIARTVILAARSFVDSRITRTAAALSFSTIMAVVPMVAVVFAIARGFGFSKHIETWFRDLLVSQPQVAETIIGFVNSYLVNVKSGIILGFGLIVMLYTVVMLISSVEMAFNDIWNVKNQRGLMRTVIDYVAFFFLLPIVIVLTSGVTIFVSAISEQLNELVAPIVRFLISASPYVIMSVIFTLVYMLMPNTKVNFSSAVWPGILAGFAMQMLQLLYIHSQVWVTSYNAIYGSFAALPLFMLWVQFSWIICLFGAHLCYTNQNMEQLSPVPYNNKIAHENKLMLSAVILAIICQRFANGEKPATTMALKKKTNIPAHIVANILGALQEAGLIVDVTGGNKDKSQAYMPAQDIAAITVGNMVKRLDTVGNWTLEDFDLDILAGKSPSWAKILEIRDEYIQKLGDVKIIDLHIS